MQLRRGKETRMRNMMLALCGVVLSFAISAPSQARDRTFGGYDCTADCSGHAAGYKWAEEHSVSDPSDCGGSSNSFVEGCQAFTADPSRGSDEDDDGESVDE